MSSYILFSTEKLTFRKKIHKKTFNLSGTAFEKFEYSE
ncbi:hypothetical protein LEP1GSC034_4463 [Leptospira interrogans str. 2003000735]|uniref:Uncharacterized protein n=13 Tax=Leptospira interrogans TaxID=173 RepID=A0A0E2D4S8_LEPIR|nr:hypothetical protein LEP1GSC045_3213 [Leptospira interrogans serovar Pomona str. Kennewicki LC82-25]EJP02397.1 hypothetical protein LEP1GSC007_0568 [Leptospira interrogans serovar Bulgarica str. Mallika]EJP13506.1 hypothetical protein LEP1GSC080_0270 [Leptospira interrogans str. FPW2026]EKN90720.1 hypothetical protein LEP1GSC027_2198 [Leptospira interrogans str. 2002000624]EKN98829.1 hypothetical protein LEP1GSC014_2635 [Leptospira interrogans serovar Pomona str. Pomona]EKO04653.1 hypotheti